MISKFSLTCSLILACLVTACGGGGESAPLALSQNVSNTVYDSVSLIQPPLDMRTIGLTEMSQEVTFSGDDVAYSVVATPALDSSSYAVSGNLDQDGLMLCKPASRLPGYRSGVGQKTAHYILPRGAMPATAADLKGRVLDLYDNCSADPKGSITFRADGTATAGSENSSVEALAAYFSSSGSSEADATYYGRIYKLGTTLFIIERAVPKPGATGEIDGVAVRNEHGYLAVYRSRP